GGGLGLGLVQLGLRLFGTLGPPAGDVVRVSALHLDGPGLQLLDAGGLGAELVAGLRQGGLGGTAAFFCLLGCFFCCDPGLVGSLAALLFIGQEFAAGPALGLMGGLFAGQLLLLGFQLGQQ